MKNPIKSFFDEKKLKKVASELGVLAKKDVLTFGKYATLRVKDVMKKDPLYLCWIHDNTSHKLQTAVILEAREKGAKQRLKQQADRDDRADDRRSDQAGRSLMQGQPDPATLAKKMEMPEEKIRKIMKISKEPISMETPIGDDDDSHLGDFIEDSSTLAPADAAMYSSLRGVTKEILDTLTTREAKVLRMRFGIEMNTDHTLEEVGKQFDVTRERIRQIEAKALRKLRHPSRSDKLRSFIDTNAS